MMIDDDPNSLERRDEEPCLIITSMSELLVLSALLMLLLSRFAGLATGLARWLGNR
jgi:hypothetical protein